MRARSAAIDARDAGIGAIAVASFARRAGVASSSSARR